MEGEPTSDHPRVDMAWELLPERAKGRPAYPLSSPKGQAWPAAGRAPASTLGLEGEAGTADSEAGPFQPSKPPQAACVTSTPAGLPLPKPFVVGGRACDSQDQGRSMNFAVRGA